MKRLFVDELEDVVFIRREPNREPAVAVTGRWILAAWDKCWKPEGIMKIDDCKAGDVVVAKGRVNSPVMTVEDIAGADAVCIWFVGPNDHPDRRLIRERIKIAALEHYEANQEV